MKYSITEKYNCVIITFKGKIMGGPASTKFHKKVKSLIKRDKTNIIADLSRVNFMNSSGLGILITALTSLRNAGGELILSGPSKRIESLLMVTKLITVFPHYKTLEQAVAAYQEQE